MKTPHEAMYRTPPDSSKLQMFGHAVFARRQKQNCTYKVYSNAENDIYLGVRNGMYRTEIQDGASVMTNKHAPFDKTTYLMLNVTSTLRSGTNSKVQKL